jgi:hypothetical protein
MHLCREYCRQCLNAVNIYIHSKTVTVQICVTEADWDFSRRTDLILPQKEHRKTVIMSILKVNMYLLINPKKILTPRRKGWLIVSCNLTLPLTLDLWEVNIYITFMKSRSVSCDNSTEGAYFSRNIIKHYVREDEMGWYHVGCIEVPGETIIKQVFKK